MLPGNEPVGPCDVCGGDPEALVDAPNGCICPECTECGAFGDPQCYEKHGLVRTAGQVANREQLDAELEAEARRETAYYQKPLCAACGTELETVFDEVRNRSFLVCPNIDKRNLLGHTHHAA
jgi:hypothetical protein